MDNDAIQDMFSGLGPITIKRMFGGKGIYFEGNIIALEVSDEILLKADKVSAPEFEAADCRQWTYARVGRKPVGMPYWSVPTDAFDDPDLMKVWARKAYEASLRAARKAVKD